METAPVLVSATALAVSVFTFWWMHLRNARSF